MVRVPRSSAGKKGKCPGCAAVIQIPAAGSATSTAGLQPLPGSEGLTPLDAGGLTPLGPSGPGSSAAGGGTDDLFADLPAPGQSAAANPFGAASGDPLGNYAGGGGLNPYAAPTTFAAKKSRAPVHTNKPKRNGLPWDNRERADSPFSDTAKAVLFSPQSAFYKMRRTGGVGGPLLFCVAGIVCGTLAAMGWNFLFQLIMIIPALGSLEADRVGAVLGAMVLGIVIGLSVGLGFAVTGAIVGAFINAGLTHVCLALVGGAEHPFETTMRVVCYTSGAAALCQVIPICGGLINMVAYPIILIIGIYAAHETSGGKAAAAVMLPGIVLCGLGALVIFLVVTTLIGIGAAQ
jgi:hypothetical protein